MSYEVVLTSPLSPAQEKIATSEARFRVVAAGRSFGKTHIAKIELVRFLLGAKNCIWIAPKWGMLRDPMDDLRQKLASVGVKRTPHSLSANGGTVNFYTGFSSISQEHLIGLDFVVIDEAAYCDYRIWHETIYPALMKSRGRALLLSTPHQSLGNWFPDVFSQGLLPASLNLHSWQSFHFTTADNPYIAPEEIEAVKEAVTEEHFRTQFLAEFPLPPEETEPISYEINETESIFYRKQKKA